RRSMLERHQDTAMLDWPALLPIRQRETGSAIDVRLIQLAAEREHPQPVDGSRWVAGPDQFARVNIADDLRLQGVHPEEALDHVRGNGHIHDRRALRRQLDGLLGIADVRGYWRAARHVLVCL